MLRKNNSVKLVGNPKKKGAVLSFTIEGIHPHDIATILDEDGVAIRAGHHCCQILHETLGMAATARASLGIYNTKDDIDSRIFALKEIILRKDELSSLYSSNSTGDYFHTSFKSGDVGHFTIKSFIQSYWDTRP